MPSAISLFLVPTVESFITYELEKIKPNFTNSRTSNFSPQARRILNEFNNYPVRSLSLFCKSELDTIKDQEINKLQQEMDQGNEMLVMRKVVLLLGFNTMLQGGATRVRLSIIEHLLGTNIVQDVNNFILLMKGQRLVNRDLPRRIITFLASQLDDSRINGNYFLDAIVSLTSNRVIKGFPTQDQVLDKVIQAFNQYGLLDQDTIEWLFNPDCLEDMRKDRDSLELAIFSYYHQSLDDNKVFMIINTIFPKVNSDYDIDYAVQYHNFCKKLVIDFSILFYMLQNRGIIHDPQLQFLKDSIRNAMIYVEFDDFTVDGMKHTVSDFLLTMKSYMFIKWLQGWINNQGGAHGLREKMVTYLENCPDKNFVKRFSLDNFIEWIIENVIIM